MITQKCTKCGNVKDINLFRFRKDRKKYFTFCRDCENERNKLYYKNNTEKVQNMHKNYIYKFKELHGVTWYELNKDRLCDEIHREKRSESRRKRFQENKQKEYAYKYARRKSNLQMRFTETLSATVRHSIKRKSGIKAYRTIELLGCTVKFLMNHLESKFTDGMNWDNYGYEGWHVDHIKPCACFDLRKPQEQKKCFNYTNLQPLWKNDNLTKNSKHNGVKVDFHKRVV